MSHIVSGVGSTSAITRPLPSFAQEQMLHSGTHAMQCESYCHLYQRAKMTTEAFRISTGAIKSFVYQDP